MRYFIGILMGLISGLIIYFIAALLFSSHGNQPGWILPIGLLGGWAFSTWLFVRNTTTAARVASRAFLFGAGEWIVMIFAGFVASGRAVTETTAGAGGEYSGAATTGAMIGGGLSFIAIAVVSVLLAIACVIGYMVTKNMGSELQAERVQLKRCSQCAEDIQMAARKCRFCGADQPLEMPGVGP